MRELFITDAPAATVLVRVMRRVASFCPKEFRNFFIRKILPLDASRKLAFPLQKSWGPFVGGCESSFCGAPADRWIFNPARSHRAADRH